MFDKDKAVAVLSSVAVDAAALAFTVSVWRFRKAPSVWTGAGVAGELLILAEQVHRKVAEPQEA